MKLVDAELLRETVRQFEMTHKDQYKDEFMNYFSLHIKLITTVCDAIKAATAPVINIIQAPSDNWTPCGKELPPKGANVILTFKDTFHTHSSWPKTTVMPAWICNVDEDHPNGEWAIEGRLGDYIIPIEDGIAWKPMPEAYAESEVK